MTGKKKKTQLEIAQEALDTALSERKGSAVRSTATTSKLKVSRETLAPVLETLKPQYDSFLDRINLVVDNKPQSLTRAILLEICLRLETQHNFGRTTVDGVTEVLETIAYRNQYDSAIEWGKSLKWDGTPRIVNLFGEYFGCEPNEFTAAVSLYFATAMAARLMTENPEGIKADSMPILVGEQGIGKTTAVMALSPFPEWFVEVSFNRKEDDLARMIKGKVIAEIAELSGLKRREAGELKAWVSRTKESWIPKFVEQEKSLPRRIMFIGTTNETTFLADKTGNRRWYPLQVIRASGTDDLVRDREQIWAEAICTFKDQGICWQEAAELAKANDVHADYLTSDPWEEEVMDWVKGDIITSVGKTRYELGFVAPADVLKNCLSIELDKRLTVHHDRVASILRSNGFTIRAQRRVTGFKNAVRGWALNQPPP